MDPKLSPFYIVEYFDGHQRQRHRINQINGDIISTNTSEYVSYLLAMKRVLLDITNDPFDLGCYLRHPKCLEEWLEKGEKTKSEPNKDDPVEVSLWNLAENIMDDDDIITDEIIKNEIENWHSNLKKDESCLPWLKTWLNTLIKHGFGCYDIDEGHWIRVRILQKD